MTDEPIRLLTQKDIEDFRATKSPNLFEIRCLDTIDDQQDKITQLQAELEKANTIVVATKEYMDYIDSYNMETYGGLMRRNKMRNAIRVAAIQDSEVRPNHYDL